MIRVTEFIEQSTPSLHNSSWRRQLTVASTAQSIFRSNQTANQAAGKRTRQAKQAGKNTTKIRREELGATRELVDVTTTTISRPEGLGKRHEKLSRVCLEA